MILVLSCPALRSVLPVYLSTMKLHHHFLPAGLIVGTVWSWPQILLGSLINHNALNWILWTILIIICFNTVVKSTIAKWGHFANSVMRFTWVAPECDLFRVQRDLFREECGSQAERKVVHMGSS